MRNVLDPIVRKRYRSRTGDTRQIPPGALRGRAGSPNIEVFFGTAHECVDSVETALQVADRSLADLESVLDFGCGCGRVLQELASRVGPAVSLHGCDVDPQAIDWTARHYRDLHLTRTDFNPPLPYPDQTFDLVYSSSVFTHLDRTSQLDWLDELWRVMCPGALALISIHGEHAASEYRSGAELGVSRAFGKRLQGSDLRNEGVLFVPHPRSRWNDFGFVGRAAASTYGMTFNSAAHVRDEWSRSLRVVTILPRSWWSIQDLVVLERAADAAST
jgi:SAM-dependent methyltransferase